MTDRTASPTWDELDAICKGRSAMDLAEEIWRLRDDGPKERRVAERCAVIVEESASYWLNEQHGARPEYLEAAKDAERICRGDAARMRALDGLDATRENK